MSNEHKPAPSTARDVGELPPVIAWAVESNVGGGMRTITKLTTVEADADRYASATQAEYAGCERKKIELCDRAALAAKAASEPGKSHPFHRDLEGLNQFIDGRCQGDAAKIALVEAAWYNCMERNQPAASEAVAWAVVAPRGGIHKLSITRESAERKKEKWLVEWPDNQCTVRPLVFGDEAASEATGQQLAHVMPPAAAPAGQQDAKEAEE